MNRFVETVLRHRMVVLVGTALAVILGVVAWLRVPIDAFPDVNKPSIGVISYHVRDGKHDITAYDWKQYIAFAKKALSK